VSAHLELITRCLVDVRRAQNVETLDTGRQRNRPTYDRTGTFGGINDFGGGLVDQLVIEGLEANTNFFDFASCIPKNVAAAPRAKERGQRERVAL